MMELLGIFLAVLTALLVRDWLRAWAHDRFRYDWTRRPRMLRIQRRISRLIGA